MSSFITADCFCCGEPFVSLTNCAVEGCNNGFCDKCLDLQSRCVRCGEIVCEEHIEKLKEGKVCSDCLKFRDTTNPISDELHCHLYLKEKRN